MLSAQDDTGESQITELSPFIVDASSDEGYLATQSQAGTRLASQLRDIAASVSVMTPQLLEDIGATDLQGALAYSVNTENEFEFAPRTASAHSCRLHSPKRSIVQFAGETDVDSDAGRQGSDGVN